MTTKPYHHGDLRRALLTEAAVAIEESGVAKLSLRDLARRAGVSHAAPTHHFGDKAGLLTALAVEGYHRLAAELGAAESFLDGGVAYVRFAVTHRAHFEVMFRPDLYHASDPAVVSSMGGPSPSAASAAPSASAASSASAAPSALAASSASSAAEEAARRVLRQLNQ
ncbi:TetR/AcrR family transcriptional regulator [Actinoplanes sp. NPDC051470]|uniref:TetR/AcrR family transcriptional regulator n=1 Tax=Actinoplanes sp. NPDC051470 TaxID=3157224 RepID=UPI003414A6E9